VRVEVGIGDDVWRRLALVGVLVARLDQRVAEGVLRIGEAVTADAARAITNLSRLRCVCWLA